MGIQGLLPLLKCIQQEIHLKDLEPKGQIIGIDGYVWLHRGVFSCALELATGKNTKK